MFRFTEVHERHKIEETSNRWVCTFCGKAFYSERFLDLHFHNRHRDQELTVGNDNLFYVISSWFKNLQVNRDILVFKLPIPCVTLSRKECFHHLCFPSIPMLQALYINIYVFRVQNFEMHIFYILREVKLLVWQTIAIFFAVKFFS